jgi:hypothetical protein
MDDTEMPVVAIDEARSGLREGGIATGVTVGRIPLWPQDIALAARP